MDPMIIPGRQSFGGADTDCTPIDSIAATGA